MQDRFYIFPVGIIKKRNEDVWIEIYAKYNAAFLGLDEFSHITVCYWFHKNDTPEKRNTMQVHPRKNKSNPLTGVFATHSPVRPNLIALTLCRILSINKHIIEIERIDANDGTPVIDIKSYNPKNAAISPIRVPAWMNARKK